MRLTGFEPILGTNGLTVLDFWKWANSDILMNAARGVFAEYLVGSALVALDGIRIEWDAFDLKYRDNGIEVKSSAYVQSWKQKSKSKPQFTIAPKSSWRDGINTYTTEKQRQASIYVFCLLVECDQNLVNPLDTNQWLFYVATVNNLNLLGGQKSIGLSHLKRISNECKYESLKLTVDQTLDNITSVS